MKRIINYIGVILLLAFIVSCQEEFEPGQTAVIEFAGDWYVGYYEEDGTENWSVYDSYPYAPLLTFNTAANEEKVLWIDDQGEVAGFKAKLNLNGEADNFTSDYGVNIAQVGTPTGATAANETVIDTVDIGYVKIDEGKILVDAAKVWADKEQAPSDSIYLKIGYAPGIFTYTSVEVIDSADNKLYIFEKTDEQIVEEESGAFILAGHRQTGWEVYIH